jgi:hypothetical protein
VDLYAACRVRRVKAGGGELVGRMRKDPFIPSNGRLPGCFAARSFLFCSALPAPLATVMYSAAEHVPAVRRHHVTSPSHREGRAAISTEEACLQKWRIDKEKASHLRPTGVARYIRSLQMCGRACVILVFMPHVNGLRRRSAAFKVSSAEGGKESRSDAAARCSSACPVKLTG